jgi:hypothetical protein
MGRPSGIGPRCTSEDRRCHRRFPVPILKMTPKCLLLYNFRIAHNTPTTGFNACYSGLTMLLMNVYWSTDSRRVFVPTMAKTDAGFWLEIDPVEEAATYDVSSIAAALQRCAARGNPAVPTPSRSRFPDWVVLKPANKKKLRDFEKEYELLSVERKPDAYLIRKHHRSKEGRGYEPEREARLTLRSESTFFEIAAALKSVAD